jgi:hypothetical protein
LPANFAIVLSLFILVVVVPGGFTGGTREVLVCPEGVVVGVGGGGTLIGGDMPKAFFKSRIVRGRY